VLARDLLNIFVVMMGTLGKWATLLGLGAVVLAGTGGCAGTGSWRLLLPGLEVGASQTTRLAGKLSGASPGGWRQQEVVFWLRLTWLPARVLRTHPGREDARRRASRARRRVIAGFAALARRWCRPGRERCRSMLGRVRDEILEGLPKP